MQVTQTWYRKVRFLLHMYLHTALHCWSRGAVSEQVSSPNSRCGSSGTSDYQNSNIALFGSAVHVSPSLMEIVRRCASRYYTCCSWESAYGQARGDEGG